MRFANARPRNTTKAGYGSDHIRSRKRAFALLPEISPCCRCGRDMWKQELEPDGKGGYRSALHYDHNPERDGYYGFSCAKCNRLAGARVGGQRQTQRRTIRTMIRSRQW